MKTLYTFGYGRFRYMHGMINVLQDNNVETIIDVRRSPNSRLAGFGKNQMRSALLKANIRYEHMPELGTPLDLAEYAKQRDYKTFFSAWRAHANTLTAPIFNAAQTAMTSPTALMCLEADVQTCHRLVVAELVAKAMSERLETEVAVKHL